MDGFNYNAHFAHRNERSMSRAGKESVRWLKDTYEWIGEILREDERRA